MNAVMLLASVVLIACGIGSLVCWIMVLIKIFRESVGLGIVGIICGLFAFIYGWVKVGEYGIKKVMLIWSVCIVVSIVLQLVIGALGASA